ARCVPRKRSVGPGVGWSHPPPGRVCRLPGWQGAWCTGGGAMCSRVQCVDCGVMVPVRDAVDNEGRWYCRQCSPAEPELTEEQCDALDAEYAAWVDALE